MTSILHWLFRTAFSAAAKQVWQKLRPNDLDSQLARAVDTWASALPPSLNVHPDAMFPSHVSDSEGACSAIELRILRGKILERELPTVDDWFFALCEQWSIRKDSLGMEAQPFFVADLDQVEQHLRDLAQSLHKVSTQDEAIFKTQVLRLLQSDALPVGAHYLEVVDVLPRDNLSGTFHSELDIKVTNTARVPCFITRAEFIVHRSSLLMHAMPRFSLVPISGYYDLLLNPDVAGTIKVPLSQVVYPNDVDRFVIRIAIAPECTLIFREMLVTLSGRLVFDRSGVAEIPEQSFSVPWPYRIRGQRGSPSSWRVATEHNIGCINEFLEKRRQPTQLSPRLGMLRDEAQRLREAIAKQSGDEGSS